jgi:hypothetical protein
VQPPVFRFTRCTPSRRGIPCFLSRGREGLLVNGGSPQPSVVYFCFDGLFRSSERSIHIAGIRTPAGPVSFQVDFTSTHRGPFPSTLSLSPRVHFHGLGENTLIMFRFCQLPAACPRRIHNWVHPGSAVRPREPVKPGGLGSSELPNRQSVTFPRRRRVVPDCSAYDGSAGFDLCWRFPHIRCGAAEGKWRQRRRWSQRRAAAGNAQRRKSCPAGFQSN